MRKIWTITLPLMITGLIGLSLAFIPSYFEISKYLDIFTSVFKEVNLYYVDETEPGELVEEAINSMLSSLDPYTNYIPEERVEDFKIQTTGNYGGIGASIGSFKGKIIITATYKGFAADKSGIKVGDVIIEINGNKVEGKSSEDVSQILKGAPSTSVEITLKRGERILEKAITREDVQVKSVPYYGMLNSEIGYIVLTSFTERASKEIKEALKELGGGNELRALVLDLRGNPGGILSEAVNVTNIFIDKGKEVVRTKGKLEEWERTYVTLNKPEDTDIPLAILINKKSASASEIVAGTLQDYDRAVVIGQRSFGKGLVQQTRKLPYGSQMKVTIAKYYTPSGRCIQTINYAERDEDGSVTKIPDSLHTKFETKSGRPVYDGGGVDPDILTDGKVSSRVLISLYREMLIFNYATEYHHQHAKITKPASRFSLSDEEYDQFKKWLNQKGFRFSTQTEKSLEKLIASAKEEKYYEDVKPEIEALKIKYEKEEQDDLLIHKNEIKSLLEEEIASRYYYEHGRIANALNHDPEVGKALETLQDLTKYKTILTTAKD